MTATSSRGRPGLLGAVLCVACSASFLFVPQAGAKHKNGSGQKQLRKAVREFFPNAYWVWVNEEVGYIITDQERATFKKIKNDDEREQFIEQFWERRNPTPGSLVNEFKKEYYRRVAFANGHFACDVPGWKTDRGRIYIQYGPPDEIEARPKGGATPTTGPGENAQKTNLPNEVWRYRKIAGVGDDVAVVFVSRENPCSYHRALNPGETDPLVPGSHAALIGMLPSTVPAAAASGAKSRDEDLRSLLYNPARPSQEVPFQVRYSISPATEMTSLVYLTIALPRGELRFVEEDKMMHTQLQIFGEITTISGRVAQVFEKTLYIDIPQNDFQNSLGHEINYEDFFPLRSGIYRMSIVVKDATSGKLGYRDIGIQVPRGSL